MTHGDWTQHATHVTPSPECHLCPKTEPSTLDLAKRRILFRLDTFMATIHESERSDFFHPCNADTWVREFARWLDDGQKASAELGASND